MRLSLLAALLLAAPAVAQDAPNVLQPFVEKHRLAGAVTLVADKEEVLAHDTVGFANIAAKTPMAKDSLFWIASMTKPITGVGLMILVDEGKVSLDDPVTKYLPELKDMWYEVYKEPETALIKKLKKPITVRQLMTHTNGMWFQTGFEYPTFDTASLKDTVRSYVDKPLLFEPGTKFSYSNAGINTAGRIIEVVSGMPYEAFMEKRLFAPLGMKDTTFFPSETQVKRLATTYKPNAKKDDLEESSVGWALAEPLTRKDRSPMPAGGLFSTASDLSALLQMVMNDGTWRDKKILSPEAVKEMTKRSTPAGNFPDWGIGWARTGDGFGHGGAHATQMHINTQRKVATVFLVQHNGFPGDGGRSYGVWKQAAEARFGTK